MAFFFCLLRPLVPSTFRSSFSHPLFTFHFARPSSLHRGHYEVSLMRILAVRPAKPSKNARSLRFIVARRAERGGHRVVDRVKVEINLRSIVGR